MGEKEKCSADEYINGHNDLDFCFDVSDDQWENAFFTTMHSAAERDDCCDDDDLNDSQPESDDKTPPAEPKIKTFKTAI